MNISRRQTQRLLRRVRELERLAEPTSLQQQLVAWTSEGKWNSEAADEALRIAELLEQVIKEADDGS